MKRCIALLLTLALLSALVPTVALADDAAPAAELQTVVASGTCGDTMNWSLDDAGTLTISGAGEMSENEHFVPWYAYRSEIKTVLIGSGVKSVSSSAFSECGSLTGAALPDGLETIGDRAFFHCGSLSTLTFGSGLKTIGSYAFDGCGSLTGVVLPDSTERIGSFAFCNCAALKGFVFPQGVKRICDHAFYGCSGLTEIVLPDSVTGVGDSAFSCCGKLTACTIGSGLTDLGAQTFYNCGSLQRIAVSADNASYASANGVLFDKELTTLILFPGGKGGAYTAPGSVITVGDYAFGCCENLTSAAFLYGVTSIGDSSFYGCGSLTGVTLPATLESIGNAAFGNCAALEEICYGGAMEDWRAIRKGSSNTALKNAQIYCGILAPRPIIGDVNGDGVVNAKDVTFLRRFLAGGYNAETDPIASDANGEGTVNAKDVTILRRYLAGGYGTTLAWIGIWLR